MSNQIKAEKHFKSGQELYRQNKYIDACNEFQKATEVDPNYIIAYKNWGNSLFYLGRYDEAIDKYLKAIEIGPNNPIVYYNWGSTLCTLKKFDEAIDKYIKATYINPKYVDAYNNWGLSLYELGRYEDAIEKYKIATQKNPEYINAYNNWGVALGKLGRYEDAIKQYEIAVIKDANCVEAYNNWGLSLHELGRYEGAIEKYKIAVNKNTDCVDAYNNWGLSLYELGRYEDAIEKYKIATQKNPEYINAYNNWGVALGKLGRYEDAIKQYECSYKIDNTFAYPLHNIAALLEKQGQYKLAIIKWAIACYAYKNSKSKAMISKNTYHSLYHGSVYQFSRINNLNKAEEIYKEGLEIDPGNINILLNLIQLYLERKNNAVKTTCHEKMCMKTINYCKAREYFRKAENILLRKFEDTNTLLELGKLYFLMEDYENSKNYLLKALEKGRNRSESFSILGAVNMREENYEEAISNFRKALTLDPDDLGLRSNLAEAYLKNNQKEKAETEYRDILEITPYHMDSLIGIGETYCAMGDDARKRNDTGSAEMMFTTASNYYSETIKLADNSDNASKSLTRKEISSVFYSKGYANVILYEIQKRKDNDLLNIALQDFRKVDEGTPNFYKAQRAIKLITDRMHSPLATMHKWVKWSIFALSIIVFILTQIQFITGRPVLGYSNYFIDRGRVSELLSEKKFDASVQDKLKNMFQQNAKFCSKDHFNTELKKEFGEKIASELNNSNILSGSGNIRIEGFQLLETGYYALLTFGALIFIIAGFCLNQLTKLKVGAIEIEKSLIDQISISPTLGITK